MDIIEWAKSQTKGGSFLAFPNCTSLPENDLFFAGTLFVNAKGDTWSISAICVTTGITYTNASSSAGSVWTGWQPLATATPPQEFDLPLAEGMSVGYPCTYYKNQFNEVKIVGAAKGNLSDGVLLATLPEGFRPSGACDRPVLFTISGSSFGGTLHVSTNGEIRCFTLLRNVTDVYFEMSFLAAG